mmetsp:Transcript_13523/g.20875  ORF Transcript_13523/g.20875 Transcript_13523/m.20875 type:complete len:255 (+) Transcript_13523:30-794(+)
MLTTVMMLSSYLLLALLCLLCNCIATAFCPSDVMPSRQRLSSLSMAESNHISSKIRYLGSGDDAIIRPGVVLVAPKHEYDHFLMKSAVFVYAIGLDENEDMVIRGVIIDHPTAFTISEMSPNVMGSLSDNLMFRGGRSGSDSAMLLHSAGGADGHVKVGEMIGSSGIYEGGVVSAMEAADAGLASPDQFKFFFNYMQFRENELEDMFQGVVDDDGKIDEWVSLEVPPEFVLNSDLERGEMWSRLRNTIQEIRKG